MQTVDRGGMPEWMLPGRVVEVQTHAWDGDGNVVVSGTIASMAHGMIYLRQGRTLVDELTGEIATQERLIALPWSAVVYLSEPGWRTIEPDALLPFRESAASARLRNLNRQEV